MNNFVSNYNQGGDIHKFLARYNEGGNVNNLYQTTIKVEVLIDLIVGDLDDLEEQQR